MIQSVLVQKAINAALNSQWNDAIELNEKILEQFPQDLDSLNRLARACFELGDISRSKKIYKEVLDHDPYNVIALKNMKRFQLFKIADDTVVKSMRPSSSTSRPVTNFIEEPGKTKVIQLVRLAEPQVLFLLHCGDLVQLTPKLRGIHAFTESGAYIGRIPDDLGFQLQIFIKSGNKYDAFIKQIASNAVHIFVRETYRVPEYASRPTFSYISESSPVSVESSAEVDVSASDQHDEDTSLEEQL